MRECASVSVNVSVSMRVSVSEENTARNSKFKKKNDNNFLKIQLLLSFVDFIRELVILPHMKPEHSSLRSFGQQRQLVVTVRLWWMVYKKIF